MYRKLSSQEIDSLQNQNCYCKNWDLIEVIDNFNPRYVRNSSFSGKIKLGYFERDFELPGGLVCHSGIYNATIHNCIIGNNVYIGNIGNYMANYIVEDDVFIDNVDILLVEGTSSFGNNIKVTVLCETGGREVPIFNQLSAQMAYILTLYRHRPNVINKISNYIEAYSKSVTSDMGVIGKASQITSCQKIKNVKIGSHARLNGVYRLQNGTINSCEKDTSFIGFGVIAENFIISTGTKIDDGAVVYNCFIGQGCILSKHYSAENSLFFANSAGFHGEACSIFAGPFTVTHHKSTLLIAGMFSFMNAGSGSNQSNHMYKLGPIHQGIMERGAKTSSDSYILWPAKIGAFTTVMGRHYKHPDTSELPFSYLIENNDESILIPGVSLRSVGTIRDAQKWPKRDKRKGDYKLDLVNFNLLSPFTIHKIMQGIEILNTLQHLSGKTTEVYSYQNTLIRNSSLRHGLELYYIAAIKFLGNSIISRLEHTDCKTDDDIRARLIPSTPIGSGDWLDLGGMIAPKSEIAKILDDIEDNRIPSVEVLHERLRNIHENYYEYEWTWAYDKLHYLTPKPINEITAQDIIKIVERWKTAVVDLDKKLYNDARKEFTLTYKVSFGTDGSEEEQNIDFEQVRGEFEKNSFVTEVLDHIRRKSELARFMIDKMEKLK
ncbi:MAG: DUF4954 family protein [Prevotellaceae bacterium]|jgi:hypothetical protein|nr:DUF4954 family protein [Prevotellaceae bacterium]